MLAYNFFEMTRQRRLGNSAISLFLLALMGCADDGPKNPSFAVTFSQAEHILKSAEQKPQPLPRPLIIVGGFLDPGFSVSSLKGSFSQYTRDDRIIAIPLGYYSSFDECRQVIVEAVDRRFPNHDPAQTTEVDVLGYSMGGLAARYAAADQTTDGKSARRLNVVRLFTISSPMRGAHIAKNVGVDLNKLQNDMHPDSQFLAKLDAGPISPTHIFPVYSYVRLGDIGIGESNTAVNGQTPWWIATPPLELAHDAAFMDQRILADIVQRIYDRKPFSKDPPANLPALPDGRLLVDHDVAASD